MTAAGVSANGSAPKFIKETERVYRLEVPFEDLFTSVFLIDIGTDGLALVDCATTDSDVKNYILPALKAFGAKEDDVKFLVITHDHSDHAGGETAAREAFSSAVVVRGEARLGSTARTYPLAGHTLGFIGAFDETDGTLISGDGVQCDGVGRYPKSLESADEYVKTLRRLKADETVKNLLFSHEYEPLRVRSLFGRRAVEDCLDYCEEKEEKLK